MAANELTSEEAKTGKNRGAKRKEWQKAYDATEARREKHKRWREENRDVASACSKRWRKANPDAVREMNKRWRKENPEKIRQLQARYRAEHAEELKRNKQAYKVRPEVRMRILVTNAKSRAKKYGLEFDGLVHLRGTMPPKCKCCDRTLDYSRGHGRGRPASPSLDRFDTNKGYTKDNVYVLCLRCNQLKNDASVEELEAIVAYMRSHCPGPKNC